MQRRFAPGPDGNVVTLLSLTETVIPLPLPVKRMKARSAGHALRPGPCVEF